MKRISIEIDSGLKADIPLEELGILAGNTIYQPAQRDRYNSDRNASTPSRSERWEGTDVQDVLLDSLYARFAPHIGHGRIFSYKPVGGRSNLAVMSSPNNFARLVSYERVDFNVLKTLRQCMRQKGG